MTIATHSWQSLFIAQRHTLLAQMSMSQASNDVRSASDGEILLQGGIQDAARLSERPAKTSSNPLRTIVSTPKSLQQTLLEYQADLRGLRNDHPHTEISGYGPLTVEPSQRFEGLDRGVVLVGKVGETFVPSDDLARLDGVEVPLTAVFIYSPDLTPAILESLVDHLLRLPTLASVVPLPAGAGDRIPLAGLTTAGTTDLMVISVLRLLLPMSVRVRASWAALGWKVAQVALAYGADEIAGWTGAEAIAYSGRVRAASRVERAELNEGLAEAKRSDGNWTLPAVPGVRA